MSLYVQDLDHDACWFWISDDLPHVWRTFGCWFHIPDHNARCTNGHFCRGTRLTKKTIGIEREINILLSHSEIPHITLPHVTRCVQFMQGFFKCVYDDDWTKLHLSLMDLILGNCAAAACLIR